MNVIMANLLFVNFSTLLEAMYLLIHSLTIANFVKSFKLGAQYLTSYMPNKMIELVFVTFVFSCDTH